MTRVKRVAGLDQLGPVHARVGEDLRPTWQKMGRPGGHRTIRERCASSTRGRKVKVTLAKI
jgi:hypothetical protein